MVVGHQVVSLAELIKLGHVVSAHGSEMNKISVKKIIVEHFLIVSHHNNVRE